MRFRNREEAGRSLAERLAAGYEDVDGVVYALPRGGVVLGAEIAKRLGMPLDLVIAREIGHPYNPDYGIGALTEKGDPVVNGHELARVPVEWFNRNVAMERLKAKRQRERYVGGRNPLSAAHKIAIVVDDGAATRLTLKAAVREISAHAPQRLIVAVPLMWSDAAASLREEADEIVALHQLDTTLAEIASYYDDFPPVGDEQIVQVLRAANASLSGR